MDIAELYYLLGRIVFHIMEVPGSDLGLKIRFLQSFYTNAPLTQIPDSFQFMVHQSSSHWALSLSEPMTASLSEGHSSLYNRP